MRGLKEFHSLASIVSLRASKVNSSDVWMSWVFHCGRPHECLPNGCCLVPCAKSMFGEVNKMRLQIQPTKRRVGGLDVVGDLKLHLIVPLVWAIVFSRFKISVGHIKCFCRNCCG